METYETCRSRDMQASRWQKCRKSCNCCTSGHDQRTQHPLFIARSPKRASHRAWLARLPKLGCGTEYVATACNIKRIQFLTTSGNIRDQDSLQDPRASDEVRDIASFLTNVFIHMPDTFVKKCLHAEICGDLHDSPGHTAHVLPLLCAERLRLQKFGQPRNRSHVLGAALDLHTTYP